MINNNLNNLKNFKKKIENIYEFIQNNPHKQVSGLKKAKTKFKIPRIRHNKEFLLNSIKIYVNNENIKENYELYKKRKKLYKNTKPNIFDIKRKKYYKDLKINYNNLENMKLEKALINRIISKDRQNQKVQTKININKMLKLY